MPTRYEYRGSGSNKFWEIERNRATVVVRWGRIGQKGRFKRYDFDNVAEAKDFRARRTRQKTRKGYRPVGQGNPSTDGLASAPDFSALEYRKRSKRKVEGDFMARLQRKVKDQWGE